MSRKGECLDHAVAERCFGRVQGERTARRCDATRQEARDEVINDIEMFYNSKRLHSYWGYVSPHDFERLPRVSSLTVRFYLTITRGVIEADNTSEPGMTKVGALRENKMSEIISMLLAVCSESVIEGLLIL
jgi:hypothetical protein